MATYKIAMQTLSLDGLKWRPTRLQYKHLVLRVWSSDALEQIKPKYNVTLFETITWFRYDDILLHGVRVAMLSSFVLLIWIYFGSPVFDAVRVAHLVTFWVVISLLSSLLCLVVNVALFSRLSSVLSENFADTKWVIRIRKSNKNRQLNGQKKKYKSTNNDLKFSVWMFPASNPIFYILLY